MYLCAHHLFWLLCATRTPAREEVQKIQRFQCVTLSSNIYAGATCTLYRALHNQNKFYKLKVNLARELLEKTSRMDLYIILNIIKVECTHKIIQNNTDTAEQVAAHRFAFVGTIFNLPYDDDLKQRAKLQFQLPTRHFDATRDGKLMKMNF